MPCSEAVLLSGVTPSLPPLSACYLSLLWCFLEASCLRAVGPLHQVAPGLSLASPCLDMRSHALPHLDIMLACKMHPAVCLHSPPNRVQFCHTLLYAVLPYPTMWSRHFHRVVLPHCVICIYTTLDCTLTLYIRRALPCCAVHHPGGAGPCVPNTVVGTL